VHARTGYVVAETLSVLHEWFSIEPDMEVKRMQALAIILRSGALPAHVSERPRPAARL
jgi:hypothetical protein